MNAAAAVGHAVALELRLEWQSAVARHVDRYHLPAARPGRDRLPGSLAEALAGAAPGTEHSQAVAAGTLVGPYRREALREVPLAPLASALAARGVEGPRAGRFYPRGLAGAAIGAATADTRPMRCLEVGADRVRLDLNHPLAPWPATVAARLLGPAQGAHPPPAGGEDLTLRLTGRGPGMQGAPPGLAVDYLGGRPFERDDPAPDAAFYARPRLVHHLDAAARAEITRLHARFLSPGTRVLDLMSSWHSHLPEGIEAPGVTGLGLNADELARNPLLSQRVVQDLNLQPALPFDDAAFDLAVCTASVEYLVRPVEVFREVARVLRPGGRLVLTFSERWFPPKVVRIWTELHPFERMGLVLAYLRLAGGFELPVTESLRGLPRPPDDKYRAVTPWSDPVYAVWAARA